MVKVKTLKFLFPLIAISFFYKPLMLFFLVIYIIYFFIYHVLRKKNINFPSLIFIIYVFLTSILADLLIQKDISFLLNNILFFVFISPIIFLILQKKNSISYDKHKIKRGIEIFLFIQIAFSLINGFKRAIEYGFRLDVNFGDIIAGTFRIPLIYTPDSANVVFTFTMILVVFIYISYFRNQTNKILLLMAFFVIFLASVNHLILAAGFSLLVTLFIRTPVKVMVLFISTVILYKLIQPVNYRLIIERLDIIYQALQNPNMMQKVSMKGEFITNFLNDFNNNKFEFLLSGLGAGTYSSRAALFFSGIYVANWPFQNISEYMHNNTYYLWVKFLNTPPEFTGAFHYPYGSLFSFIAEIGLLNTLILLYLFYYSLKIRNIFTKSEILFILIFLLLAGIVDNYWEYFQSTFIFYYIISHLPPKYREVSPK